jgi:hypothetical protein
MPRLLLALSSKEETNNDDNNNNPTDVQRLTGSLHIRDTEVHFGGIDYAPQKLGDRIFWLPSRFYARDAKDRARMIATYSNCRRYIGELKILPSVSLPGAGPAPR